MTARGQRTERRADALTRQRIVAAAIEILDTGGDSALTYRALAAHLATGAGAIYWHVAGKDELLTAATDTIIARAIARPAGGAAAGPGTGPEPQEAIRDTALAVFDAIDAHPWAGAQLSREPWQPAVLAILEAVGHQIQALGVPERAQLDCASALVNYILGLAGQYAAAARLAAGTDRTAFLAGLAERWAQLSPAEHSFARQMATWLPGHDDREQFLTGVSLILTGIAAVR